MRERAVRSVQDGESPEVVADVLGINRSTIYGWLAQYRHGGWGALKAKPLFGRPPKLDGTKSRRDRWRARPAPRRCRCCPCRRWRCYGGFRTHPSHAPRAPICRSPLSRARTPQQDAFDEPSARDACARINTSTSNYSAEPIPPLMKPQRWPQLRDDSCLTARGCALGRSKLVVR